MDWVYGLDLNLNVHPKAYGLGIHTQRHGTKHLEHFKSSNYE